MIVAVENVDVASAVDRNVHELVPIGDSYVGIVVHDVIAEGLAAIDGHGDPDCVLTAGKALQLTGVGDGAEDLVDGVIAGIDGEVSNLVLQRGVEQVGGVKGTGVLREGRAAIEAAVDYYVVCRRQRVIGDADLAGAIGRDPFPVVRGNAGAHRIDRPGGTAVLAGADIDLD